MNEGNGVAGIGAGMVSVSRSQLEAIHRDLDACQKVIWLAGGFDPAYCQDAQARLKEIAAILAQPAADEQAEQQPAVWATHPKGAAVDADCGLVGAEEAKNYAPGCVTQLYAAPIAQTAPQPEQSGLDQAKQQIAGFICGQRYDARELIGSMDLSLDEWQQIKAECNWIPASVAAEFDAALSAQGGE